MKELVLKTQIVGNDKQQMMTSLEIAELTGKQHKNVMQAIRNMEPAWVNIAGSNFRLGSYKDANGQIHPCYQLTKTECLYIADELVDRDLVRMRTYVSYSLKGEKKVRTYMTWTINGLHYLNAKLGYPRF